MRSAGILLVGVFGLAGEYGAWAQSSAPTPLETVIDYPIPTANSQPNSIVTGPDGNLWFTEFGANQIGRITPAGVIAEYAIPTSYSWPAGIVNGPDGNLWFTESMGHNIGKITPSGTITEYPVPGSSTNGGPYAITVGPDGNLWFAALMDGYVGKITPAGAVTTYSCAAVNSSCFDTYGIAVGPDGNLWFSPQYDRTIYEITPGGSMSQVGGFTAHPIGTVQPIARGPDGNIWGVDGGDFVKITSTLAMTRFPAAPNVSDITTGPDGNLWFTERYGLAIGRLTTGGVVTMFPIPATDSEPLGITASPDGNIWFTEEYGNNVGTLLLSGQPSSAPTLTPSSLTFSGAAGGSAPASQTLTLSAPNPTGFTVSATTHSSSTWLTVTPSGSLSTNETLTVSADPTGLAIGNYTGWIIIRSGYVTQTLTVTLTLSAAASGNVITSPSTISYTYTPGGSTVPGATELDITGAAGRSHATSYTISTSVTSPSGGNWLDVSGSQYGTAIANGTSLTTPSILYVSVSTTGLSAGVYSGTIVLTPAGGTVLTIPVTLTVNAPVVPVLTARPSTVSFSYQQGAYPPAAQWITVNEKNGVEVNYTATASSSPSGWLVVSPAYGYTSTSVAAGLARAVVAGLAPGSYSGSIVITPSVAGSAAITVPVTLSVIAAPVTISPSALNFTYAGGSLPASQSIQLSAAGGAAVPFAAQSGNSNWFSIAPISGSTPATLVVSVTPAGLAAGLYEGSLLVTAGVGTATNFIPIALNVSAGATISVDIPSLQLSYQIGGGLPPTQSIVARASGGAAVPFTATASANWLSVTQASATTLCYLSVSVNPAGLAAGTYNANVTLTADIAGNPQTLVPVTLTVTAAPTVTASPASLNFAFQIGGSVPAVRSIQLTASDRSALAFTATASSTGSWLSAAPASGRTPATLTVSVNPAGLAAGTYEGTITLTANATGSPQILVPVFLTVTAAPTVSVIPASLSFAYQIGGSLPAAQFVQLTASDNSALSFTAVASSGGNWLSVAPTSGTTPASLAVSVALTGLAVGTHNGTIVAGGVAIPVSLTVSAAPVVSASPSFLSFSYQTGGTLPAFQSIQVSASGGAAVAFTAAASSSGGWLSVAPTSGTTPAALSVSVAPTSLAAGTYSGTVTVNGTAVVTVSLTISAAPVVSVSPTALSFSYQIGGTVPAFQSIQVSASGGAAVAFTAAASSIGNWLSVAPTGGTTTATLSVSVARTSLAAGTYSGTVTVNGAIGVSVSLTVTSASPASVPVVNAVLNAASYSNAGVSPGEMVSVFGTSIGPADPAFLKLDATGNVSSALSGVTVSFGGFAAPLTYVSATQINAVVPYEIAGASTASVSYGGQTSNQPSLQLTPTAPAIFTQNGSGTGPGAILNQDFSLNTQANPAAKESTIQIYMTGEGLTAPTQATGTVTPVNASGAGPITPAPQQSITVLVGGQPAQVQFSGEAPGDVAGVMQVNALVPSSASSGALPIMVRVGNAISQTGVTVWVR